MRQKLARDIDQLRKQAIVDLADAFVLDAIPELMAPIEHSPSGALHADGVLQALKN